MVQMQTIRAFSFLCPPPDTVSFLFGFNQCCLLFNNWLCTEWLETQSQTALYLPINNSLRNTDSPARSCMWKDYRTRKHSTKYLVFYLCRPPSCSRKGIWSSLLVVIRLMMINDYNNNTGIIGANCAFWNGLHGGQAVGREKAASASGSWKDGTNWLKAALLIALARAWEKALVWLYMNGVPQSPVILGYICSSKHKQKREQMFSHLTEI